jgi:putative ABC transport system permease protein
MSWYGSVRTATGGKLRHKVQSVVIASVLLTATASATLGFALLAASDAPFQHAFAAQRGADVTLTVNPRLASTAQLDATRSLRGVTAGSGPFPQVIAQIEQGGEPWGPTTLVGRPAPSGPVDDLVLNAGHWVTGPGQIVLSGTPANQGLSTGAKLTVTGVPGNPVLVVVGFANSITDSGDGWVAPAEIAALGTRQNPVSQQLLYRFSQAATNAQIRSDIKEVTAALPPGAVTGNADWLAQETQNSGPAATMEPFVVAFAFIGLVLAVLIVGNVISGAVVAGYQRIGVLKSIGLTPAQVVATYLIRVGWPAVAGCVAGVAAGNVLAIPVLNKSAAAYNVGSQQVPVWAIIAAPLGMLTLTMLAALGPALRAGRLSATQAIAAGRAPRPGRGYALHRLTTRLGLPRPVAIGLAAPFARPARTAVTFAAIAFGTTALIFAVGLHSSLSRAAASQTLSATVPVQVQQDNQGSGPNGVPSAAQDAAVVTALNNQPGTLHEVAVYNSNNGSQLTVAGMPGTVNAWAFGGDSAWTGYGMIAGHWFNAPGEVDVNTEFLDVSGLTIGDTTTVNTGTATVIVRIVGEVFVPSHEPRLYGSTRTLTGLGTPATLWQYDVGLRPGTSVSGYVASVNNALGQRSPWAAGPAQGGQFYVIASALIGMLALMVAIAAGLGVLNTVLMTTRDRVHDLGVFKALGMRPAQVLVMVVCWIAGPAVLAAVIAAPAAVLLNDATVNAMAGTVHTAIPASFLQVFPPARLALLAVSGLVLAAAAALLPASWAARARPAVALRAE